MYLFEESDPAYSELPFLSLYCFSFFNLRKVSFPRFSPILRAYPRLRWLAPPVGHKLSQLRNISLSVVFSLCPRREKTQRRRRGMIRGDDNYVPVAQFPKREPKNKPAQTNYKGLTGSNSSNTAYYGSSSIGRASHHGLSSRSQVQKDARGQSIQVDSSRNGSLLPISDVTAYSHFQGDLGLQKLKIKIKNLLCRFFAFSELEWTRDWSLSLK